MDKQFDIQRDQQLILKGSHFWCEICLAAREVEEQSDNPRLCRRCASSIKESRDWKYIIPKNEDGLLTLSKVEKAISESLLNNGEASREPNLAVAKIPDKGILYQTELCNAPEAAR